jgi:hypothetical protein
LPVLFLPDVKDEAAFKLGGTHVDCYRFRADVSDHCDDWATAKTQYAAAVAKQTFILSRSNQARIFVSRKNGVVSKLSLKIEIAISLPQGVGGYSYRERN